MVSLRYFFETALSNIKENVSSSFGCTQQQRIDWSVPQDVYISSPKPKDAKNEDTIQTKDDKQTRSSANAEAILTNVDDLRHQALRRRKQLGMSQSALANPNSLRKLNLRPHISGTAFKKTRNTQSSVQTRCSLAPGRKMRTFRSKELQPLRTLSQHKQQAFDQVLQSQDRRPEDLKRDAVVYKNKPQQSLPLSNEVLESINSLNEKPPKRFYEMTEGLFGTYPTML